MKNYPPITDPLVLNFISCSELPLYLINTSLGFRAEGHSYMDMAHHKALSTRELIRMRVQHPEQFKAADEIAQEKTRRDLVPYYQAIKGQLDLADLELSNRDMKKMSHGELTKYRAKLFDQLKRAHWTEIEPDKEVICELNTNDIDYLTKHRTPLKEGFTPYSDEATERWTDTPRYAILAAQHEARLKAKEELAAAARTSATEELKSKVSCEAPLLKAQPDPVHAESRPTDLPAQQNPEQPEPEQFPAETRLTEKSAAFAGPATNSRHRGIDRMACSRNEAHGIAAEHPWL